MCKSLEDTFTAYDRVAVAFSGGVDSSLLLISACKTLGAENVLALTARSSLTTSEELERAAELAGKIGAKHIGVEIEPLELPEVAENTPMRCYHCKKAIYSALIQKAAMEGFGVLLDGQNADDESSYRPGRKAATELGVVSPLKMLSKNEIREAVRKYGLSEADKPASPCLATRIPYGTRITAEALRRIEAYEEWIRERGYEIVRVRHHGELARIETDVPLRLIGEKGLAEEGKRLGYNFITIDAEGYRSGCYDGGLEVDR